MRRRWFNVYLLLFSVVLLDQVTKVWVKTHLSYGEEIRILGQDWALIHFVENDGMAFGISFGGAYGKLLLSLFRLGAVTLLLLYLRQLLRSGVHWAVVTGFTLIEAGAVGNIIDSVFYGRLFSYSVPGGDPAQFLPPGGGYAPLLHGRVVDMLYFPVAYGNWPEWLPGLGGRAYVFFRPVFNLADVAISVGVVIALVGYYGCYRPSVVKVVDGADGAE